MAASALVRSVYPLLGLMMALGLLAPAGAQTIGPGQIEALRLADQLSRYGQQSSDPWALVSAVRLYRASGSSPSRGTTVTASADKLRRPSEEALLQQASRLAQNRPALLAAMDDEFQLRTKAAVIGPAVERLVVAASDTWSMVLRFVAGKPATFGIAADRLDDLRLAVQDGNGKPLCMPSLRDGELLCRWQPYETTEVRIEVANRGNTVREMVFFHD